MKKMSLAQMIDEKIRHIEKYGYLQEQIDRYLEKEIEREIRHGTARLAEDNK